MRLEVIKNAKRNMVTGVFCKLVVILCPFIERTAINRVLGSEYLGLSSLFTSVLNVLSLSELGFGTAIVYHMYQPAAEGDTKKINALLSFYRKAYRIIGLIILFAGLALIPFLGRLIKGNVPTDVNVTVLYLVYLLNTVLSYFLYAYLTSVITVYQREDLNNLRYSVVKLCLTAAQITVLLLTRNYSLFIYLVPVFTVINSVWLYQTVRKEFPQYKPEGAPDPKTMSSIKELVSGTFIHKVCTTTRNSVDTICASAFLGLTATAVYNNYYQIMLAVTTFLSIFTASLLGGVGNHMAVKSREENFSELEKMDFVYLLLSSWCFTCLMCLYQPFMEWWMGKEMMLPRSSMILFCIYFYLTKLGDVRYLYVDTTGLWSEHKKRSVAEIAMNLILNTLLAKLIGINGILIATVLSFLLCNYVWGSKITIERVFGADHLRSYYRYQFTYTAGNLLAGILTSAACRIVPKGELLPEIFLRAVICLVVPFVCYGILYRKNGNFMYLLEKLRKR